MQAASGVRARTDEAKPETAKVKKAKQLAQLPEVYGAATAAAAASPAAAPVPGSRTWIEQQAALPPQTAAQKAEANKQSKRAKRKRKRKEQKQLRQKEGWVREVRSTTCPNHPQQRMRPPTLRRATGSLTGAGVPQVNAWGEKGAWVRPS